MHQGGLSEGHLKIFRTLKFEFFTYFLYFQEICLNLDIFDFLIVLVGFSAFYRDLKQVSSLIFSCFMVIFPRTIEIFEKFHEIFSVKFAFFKRLPFLQILIFLFEIFCKRHLPLGLPDYPSNTINFSK